MPGADNVSVLAEGAGTIAHIDGTLNPADYDLDRLQTGFTHPVIKSGNGGKLSGAFRALTQNSALTARQLRYDLAISPDQINLLVSPATLPEQNSFHANTAVGAQLLNQLRDTSLAL